MIVVDASVLIDASLGRGLAARRLLNEVLVAPQLLDVEVVHGVRRLVHRGDIELEHAERALAELARLDIGRFGHEPLVPRVWELRHQVSAHDGFYVALAEDLGVPLLTLDGRLSRAHGLKTTVELLSAP